MLGTRIRLGWALTPTALAMVSCQSPLRDMDLRPYPGDLPLVEVLDVQVQRDEVWITMTYTSARSFGPSTLWINGAYSREIRGFEPGQTLTLLLNEFRREDGKRFRAGGFFATELPSDLVLAEIEAEEGRFGFIVVDGKGF
jgi:hypothetical protein